MPVNRTCCIMYHPLPATHREGMILGYLQIIHRLGPRHHLPPGDDSHTAICSQEVHAQLDLTHRQEAAFYGEERMLLVGMDHLARCCRWFAVLALRGGDRQVHQVVVRVFPHVHGGFEART